MKLQMIISVSLACLWLNTIAQIINVPADQASIQAGIDAAADGDTVLVADDTYLENINFMGKAITVASNFLLDGDTNHINNTIIDGSQPANPDYGSVVSFISGEDTTSVLCGFTITGGSGMAEPTYGARIGGGIVCYYSSAKIIYNKIVGNEVISQYYAWGGGIESFKETGDYWTVITNNTIINNQSVASTGMASGGGLEIWGDARICNNSIINNHCISTIGEAAGGGLFHQSFNYPEDVLYLYNNIIQYNTAEASGNVFGGGMFCRYANCFISGNLISHNTLSGDDARGGGINIHLGALVEITNNTISNNSVSSPNTEWFGAGINCELPIGMTLISGNEFLFNSGPVEPVGAGGGLCLLDADQTSIVVNANRFHHNTAYHGGGVFERSSYNIYFSNNIFNGNITYRGGGIGMFHPAKKSGSSLSEAKDFHPQIMNNTFYSDSASNDGGAIRFDGVMNAPEIVNCIFWENTASSGKDIQNFSSLPVTVSYSDLDINYIAGQWTGEGNINADPQFLALDPLCHLSESSPCRDTGIVSFQAPHFDYDGDSRPDPVFALMDMGADEYYEIPAAPLAMEPIEVGDDYFIATWNKSLWAQGYYLDVAYDENFNVFFSVYNNYDVGNDTVHLVENLEPGLLYHYRVRAYNGSGVSSNSNTITVLPENVDEMQAIENPFQLQVFPNPCSNAARLRYLLKDISYLICDLYSVSGIRIERLIDEVQKPGAYEIDVDVSDLPAGLYVVRMQTGNESAIVKLVLIP